MKPILAALLSLVVFGCNCNHSDGGFAPTTIADSVYLRFADLNADKTILLDSSVVVELKKTDRLNQYYDVFVSEFNNQIINGFHFVEKNAPVAGVLQNENDIRTLHDCINSDSVTENFSEDFLQIYTAHAKSFENDTMLHQLENLNEYLSQSTYFQDVA